jgi:putative Holliday junction resolvase
MVKILAVDYGKKRLGIAVSDELELVATPLGVINNDKNLYDTILSLITKNNIKKVLVGLPQWESKSYIVDEIKTFVKNLEKKTDIEIELVNEYYSTKSAIEKLSSLGKKIKKVKYKLDTYAACEILQDYLNKKL